MDILADILGEDNQPEPGDQNEDDDDDLYGSSLINVEAEEEVDEVEEEPEVPPEPEKQTTEVETHNREEIDASHTKFFTVKASTHDEVAKSYESSVWNLSAAAKHKVADVLSQQFAAILFVTISGSRNFQGYMKVSSSALAVDDSTSSQAIEVAWKKLCHLSYNSTTHIKNPLNDNQSVKLCRDGQELEGGAAQALIDLMHSLPDETLASQKEKLSQGIILAPAQPQHQPRQPEQQKHEEAEHDEKRLRKDSDEVPWYERVKPNPNVQHILNEHSYLNEMDITNMSYDEYLERFRMMQARAHEQFQMAFMPPPGYFPPMGMPMGMPPGMYNQQGFGGQGFPHHGPPRGKF